MLHTATMAMLLKNVCLSAQPAQSWNNKWTRFGLAAPFMLNAYILTYKRNNLFEVLIQFVIRIRNYYFERITMDGQTRTGHLQGPSKKDRRISGVLRSLRVFSYKHSGLPFLLFEKRLSFVCKCDTPWGRLKCGLPVYVDRVRDSKQSLKKTAHRRGESDALGAGTLCAQNDQSDYNSFSADISTLFKAINAEIMLWQEKFELLRIYCTKNFPSEVC